MAFSVNEMQQRVRSQLSTGSRLAHTAVGVAGLGMTALALSLLATETGLPGRTIAAFWVIALGGLAWAVFAVWVTYPAARAAGHPSRRRGRARCDAVRSVPGRSDRPAPRGWTLAIAVNAGMLALAIAWLMRARRRVAALRARCAALDTGA